jgi:hypothetical protein
MLRGDAIVGVERGEGDKAKAVDRARWNGC